MASRVEAAGQAYGVLHQGSVRESAGAVARKAAALAKTFARWWDLGVTFGDRLDARKRYIETRAIEHGYGL